MYRLVTYSVTGSDALAVSGPGDLEVLDGVGGWGCYNGPLSWLCGHSSGHLIYHHRT